jgi:hypothetical protein
MYGPLEYAALSFEGNFTSRQFTGEILPALREVIDQGIVRIVDLAFLYKDQDGVVTVREIEEVDPTLKVAFDPVVAEVAGLFSQGDLEAIGSLLANNSSAAMILWESSWARKFAQAVVNANGRVLARETVPFELVQAALNAGAAGSSTAD